MHANLGQNYKQKQSEFDKYHKITGHDYVLVPNLHS